MTLAQLILHLSHIVNEHPDAADLPVVTPPSDFVAAWAAPHDIVAAKYFPAKGTVIQSD